MTTTLLLAFAATLVVAGPSAHGQTAPVKNIVLVHGAFVDGSSWAKVARLLQVDGYNVTAVQNPLTDSPTTWQPPTAHWLCKTVR